MRTVPIVLASIASLAVLTAAKPPQKSRTFTAEYEASYLAFTIGKATITTQLTSDSIAVAGTAGSAGLARLFDRTNGSVTANAQIKGDAIQPVYFKLAYQMGKKPASVTEIHFNKGAVSKSVIEPASSKPAELWVPVGKKDLLSVFDPLTSSIIKASRPEEVCARTIRAYDGQMRADIVLSYKSTATTKVPGFSPAAVTCAVKYRPVSGYRKDRKDITNIRDKGRIEVTFAQLADTGLYVPVHGKAKADFGTVTIRARRVALTN